MRFQRRHMEVLVTIADSGSIHKAALQLGISQPAVSKVLADIELAYGAKLFERAASGSSLTEKGQALVAQARFLLRGIERMDRVAQSEEVVVRFGCIPRSMRTLMPHIVNRMSRRPKVTAPYRLHVVEEPSTSLFVAIQRASLDFAVMRHVGGEDAIGRQLTVERLYDERPLIVASPHHPLAKRRQIALRTMLDCRWALPAKDTTSRAVLDRFCQEQGMPLVQPFVETRSLDTSMTLASSTDLLSVLPESLARPYEEMGLVRVLPVVPLLPSTAVLLVSYPQAVDDPALADFRQLVLDAAADARDSLSLHI